MTKSRTDDMTLRPARAEDAADLSALAMASKAYWGYDDDFMEKCRDELTITAEQIQRETIVLAEADGRVAGFYAFVAVDDKKAEVMDVFVDPAFIGSGLGGRLFEHMRETARSAGIRKLEIDADPNARPFYERMGAKLVGEAASVSIPGRMLPQLVLDL